MARLLLVATFAGSTATALPVISEILADNGTGLRDGDGEYSDWIEIFNPDPVAVDLDGYCLTDDPAAPAKWRFPPATTLGPLKFLIVFASNKNRAVSGQQLHTNFKLDGAGEYLALVAPDGVTVVSGFVPMFPVQFTNASYGLEQTAITAEEPLVDSDAPCTVHVPTDTTLGTSWMQAGFDDTAWTAGTPGVGYERGTGYESLINLDVEQDMYSQNGSVYIRIPFEVPDPGGILDLRLEMQFDDAFEAYLNGTRVAGANAVVYPAWNANATTESPDGDALDLRTYSLQSRIGLLESGDALLAIQGLNINPSDDDFLIRPQLVATRLTGVTMGGLAYFTVPTPGAPNGVQQQLPASKVIFSEPGRTFTSPFQVTLSSEFGEVIRYTLNGTVPSTSSPVYAAPLTLTNSTQLRARVFAANNAVGPLAMETYLRLSADLQNFSSNLPIVILENWGRGRPGTETNTPGFWAIIEPDGSTNSRAEMLDPFQVASRCGMRNRGSSSEGWPKYSLSIEAQDENGLDKGIKPLGMPKESDWILSGRYQFDPALMRNDLMYELSNQTGEYAVRTRVVEVFNNTDGGNLSYAGDYFGVYTLMEKIKRDDNRVAVAEIGPRDVVEPKVSGGYMFKKDRLDPGDSGFAVNHMGTFGWVEPKESEVHRTQRIWLQNYLNELDAALYASNWTNPATRKHFTEYIDSGSWLRHHWLNTLAMNVDGFRLSGYYYKHRSDTNGGRLGAGPIWDFDRTMESTDGRDDSPTAWDGSGDSSHTWDDSRFPWWGRALTNPDFRQAHTDLWQELRKTTFSTANINSIIDDLAAQIDFQDPAGVNSRLARSPAARNFAKWTQYPPRGGSHAAEVTLLKNWLVTRGKWIDQQYTAPRGFSVAPGLVSPGSTVGFTGRGGTVYYTTDGSDPRLPGGGVSSSASSSLPVVINSTTIITVRARNGTGLTSWSGPSKGIYLVGPLATASNLVITEVHYAPLPPATPAELAATTEVSDFEFLELMNISPTDTIDLTEVHFEAGIDFRFTGSAVTSLAPGERVLIVGRRAAFEARYGTGHSARIAGEFAPSRLDNAGERLHLVDALGVTIADFSYHDKSPWPPAAGFAGYSMVLRSPAISDPDYTVAGNWRSSGFLGGNPNATDSTTLVGVATDDDDHDGLNNLLEHALGTGSSQPGDPGRLFSFAIQSLEVAGSINDYMTFTHRLNLTADDVILDFEGSFDLMNWLGGDAWFPVVSEVNQGDGTSLLTHRTLLPFTPGANPNLFLRLRVRSLLAPSFADWLAGQGATDPQAPFAGSSLSNLLAYAVGADLAATPEAALPAFLIINEAGVDYPALRYRVRQGAGQLTCAVEVSTDLVTWQDGEQSTVEVAVPQDNGDGTRTVTVRTLKPVTAGPALYLRLRVSLPP
ncbi:MAG: CotH kinase family protein [Akkermansiaceae bacterium]|nr:CotH kinase family protein [Akkermansiaceae bacterium]MCF7731536.1 CotH kinase family protein [Akkermansiaceae bacterium]